MTVLFHSRTANEFDWEKQIIELRRLPCVGEHVSIHTDGREPSHHEVRHVVHVVGDGEIDAEIYCNRISLGLLDRIGPNPTDRKPEEETTTTAILLTIGQAAAEARVSVATIRRRIDEGRLDAVNYGTAKRKDWRIDPAKLAALKPIEQPQEEPAPTPPQRVRRRRRQPSSGLAADWWTKY